MHVVQTSVSLAERMKRLPDAILARGRPRTSTVVHVQDGVRYQRILGFGATLTDSSAWLIRRQLSPSDRTALMGQLFGPDGLNLDFIRLPMGASDFTARGKPYSYDDMPRGQSDPSLQHFSIAHDMPYIIPTLREALAIHPRLFVFANPWTAPAWMKANQATDDFGNVGTLLPAAFGPFAAYFVKFVQAYARQGIAVDAIGPENEPVVAEDPGMQFSEADEATFVSRYLHPALMSAGLSTQVYGLDLSWDMLSFAQALAQDIVPGELTGISWHCYFGTPAVMTALHVQAPQLVQLINECSPEIRPFTTPQALIGSLRNWASAVALWNLALDPSSGPVEPPRHRCPRCEGVVTIDETTHIARPGPTYYGLGQFSRFIARGAVRIGTNTFVADQTGLYDFYRPTPGLDDVAFLNPSGEKVLVTYNGTSRPLRFAVGWRGRVLDYRLPAQATTTFTWR
ncbi:MAG TPA: glycoside hydrolase family 30 beta sandwich domain-containing protein [Solirubrobacteraceae bacterium]|nr:glycoside hydrolase family 30 beta sandwich domain-containing protein [Solirubrobacteraceae bacterium]